MLRRVISSVAGLPLLFFVVYAGGWWLRGIVFFLIIVAMYEVYKALSGSFMAVHCIGYFFAALYMWFIDSVSSDYKVLTIIMIIMTLTALCALVLFYGKVNIMDVCVTLFGFFYVAILLSSVYLTREYRNGAYFVWIIFISAWGSDTGAYFAGRLFGRHKMAPILSPKKTVEGAVGGALTGIALSVIYGIVVSKFFKIDDFGIKISVVTGACGAVFAEMGDLCASAIKRFNGVKDFGRLIPGHGGVLDRFDSVLFTAPAVYIALLVLISK